MMISLSAPSMRHRTGRAQGLCLLAVALLWAAPARAQLEPGTDDHIAAPVPPGLWARVTGAIRPPPGAHALPTATAFFIPSPDPQLRLMTSAHVTDGCLRIDLLWRRDGALRLWSGKGDRIDVWASPNGSITSVVPLKNARGSVAMLVGRHVYLLQVGA
jgi:hypothetical protein